MQSHLVRTGLVQSQEDPAQGWQKVGEGLRGQRGKLSPPLC